MRISAFDDRGFKSTSSDEPGDSEELPSNATNAKSSNTLSSSGSVKAGAEAAPGEKAHGRHVQWEATTDSEETAATASRALSKSPSPATDRKGKMSKVKPDLPMKDNKDCE